MKRIKGDCCHQLDPQRVPNLTGNWQMDRELLADPRPRIQAKVRMYVGKSKPLTNYDGYHGYDGDN